jgi:hypothetical protein
MDNAMDIAAAIDNLAQLERTVKELRQWGQPEEVIDMLQWNSQDDLLTKRLKETRLDTVIMRTIRSLWSDRKLGELQDLQQLTIERLQEIMWTSLHDFGRNAAKKGVPLNSYRPQEQLCTYTFICIRHIRDPNCHEKPKWEKLFSQVVSEAHKLGYSQSPISLEAQMTWVKWMKRNTMLLENASPGPGDNVVDD